MNRFIVLALVIGYALGNSSGQYEDECHQNCDNNYWTCYSNNWEGCYNEAQNHAYVNENCFNDCVSKSHSCLSDLGCFNQYDCYMNGDVWGCTDCVWKCGHEQTCIDNICKTEQDTCHNNCPQEHDCMGVNCMDQIEACFGHSNCAGVIQQIEEGNLCQDPTWCFKPENQINMCNQDTQCQEHFAAVATCFEQHCFEETNTGGEGESSYYDPYGSSSTYEDSGYIESSSYYDPYTADPYSGESSSYYDPYYVDPYYADPYTTSSYYDPYYVDPYTSGYTDPYYADPYVSSYYDPCSGCGNSNTNDPYSSSYMPPSQKYKKYRRHAFIKSRAKKQYYADPYTTSYSSNYYDPYYVDPYPTTYSSNYYDPYYADPYTTGYSSPYYDPYYAGTSSNYYDPYTTGYSSNYYDPYNNNNNNGGVSSNYYDPYGSYIPPSQKYKKYRRNAFIKAKKAKHHKKSKKFKFSKK